jgi:hypothetical protein
VTQTVGATYIPSACQSYVTLQTPFGRSWLSSTRASSAVKSSNRCSWQAAGLTRIGFARFPMISGTRSGWSDLRHTSGHVRLSLGLCYVWHWRHRSLSSYIQPHGNHTTQSDPVPIDTHIFTSSLTDVAIQTNYISWRRKRISLTGKNMSTSGVKVVTSVSNADPVLEQM